uniref:Arf-GAP domain-containing protein n=1 Tax=Opuntia streptacantha TaxID=393608 RepID=A0A7C9APJ3_OPUST
MASRLKEDEKNERIIRGLLKLPPNRKCINCSTLGPQYVCTNFSTFVCTTCAGIHREFTHRIKSISMAKFTPQEVANLQEGGNERAREIYFKEWDPQRNLPDSNNVDRLRDFIKHVYVHRRYTGEGGIHRPPQVGKEQSNENRKSDAYHSGSQSPPYDDTYRRNSDRASPGYDVRRSPGYDLDNKRYSDFGKSPVRSGLVNDWRREDRFSNGSKSEDRRSSDGESRSEVRSPDSQRDSDISSPPMVRPVRDILGDNVVPLRISEPPKNDRSRVTDGPILTKRTASSSSLASSNGNPAEVKRETSLIDFDAEPEPPVMPAETQAQPSTTCQSVGSTSTPSGDNWACFDNIQENMVSQAPPSSNSLESVLLQSSFSASESATSGAAAAPSNGMFPSSTASDLLLASEVNFSKATFNGVPSGGAADSPASNQPLNSLAGQWAGMQQQLFTQAASNQPAAAHLVSSFPNGSSNQGGVGNPAAEASQANPVVQTAEVKSSGRTELPSDLFTATYVSVPYQAPGWQAGLPPGMGYPMQYNSSLSALTFPQAMKPSNPFDVKAEPSPTQATVFPSMSPLNAALPNMGAPTGFVDPSIPSWLSPQLSSYPSTVTPLAQPFGSAMSGTYMGQELPGNMAPSRTQGFGAFGSEIAPFGSLNTSAVTPSPSVGGNPFD